MTLLGESPVERQQEGGKEREGRVGRERGSGREGRRRHEQEGRKNSNVKERRILMQRKDGRMERQ